MTMMQIVSSSLASVQSPCQQGSNWNEPSDAQRGQHSGPIKSYELRKNKDGAG